MSYDMNHFKNTMHVPLNGPIPVFGSRARHRIRTNTPKSSTWKRISPRDTGETRHGFEASPSKRKDGYMVGHLWLSKRGTGQVLHNEHTVCLRVALVFFVKL